MQEITLSNRDRLTVEEAYHCGLYQRSEISGSGFPFHGQWFEFAARIRIFVGADQRALGLDFETESARPDVAGKAYRGRPGAYLSVLTRLFADTVGDCLSINGNNIGYWANQFIIRKGHLVYKTVTPMFFDDPNDISGSYPFVGQLVNSDIAFRRIKINADSPQQAHSKILLRVAKPTDIASIVAGISGYPLIERGRPVWSRYIDQAWDPKLVFYVGDLTDVRHRGIVRRLREAQSRGDQLQRHGLTFLGVNEAGRLCALVVAEGQSTSRGINLEEAADLLAQLGVTSCIVLGGKGDVQSISSLEGALIEPLLSPHDRDSAMPIHALGFRSSRSQAQILERPIPSWVVITSSDRQTGNPNSYRPRCGLT